MYIYMCVYVYIMAGNGEVCDCFDNIAVLHYRLSV